MQPNTTCLIIILIIVVVFVVVVLVVVAAAIFLISEKQIKNVNLVYNKTNSNIHVITPIFLKVFQTHPSLVIVDMVIAFFLRRAFQSAEFQLKNAIRSCK